MTKIVVLKGGKGSGHKGHKGRPGKQGGSLPNSDFQYAPKSLEGVKLEKHRKDAIERMQEYIDDAKKSINPDTALQSLIREGYKWRAVIVTGKQIGRAHV